MTRSEKLHQLIAHEDPGLFRENLIFTAGRTGYSARLIEKDYFCTILLQDVSGNAGQNLVFKGGTCFAKVYFEFYRLSEDLDFMVAMPVEAKRKERSRRADSLKQAVNSIPERHPLFRIVEPLHGVNEARQYLATIGYESLLDGRAEIVNLEIGLREPLLRDSVRGMAKTILLNATDTEFTVPPFQVSCLSLEEAIAEKFRAALSRREVAIRDFFDIDQAIERNMIDVKDSRFFDMIRKKLAIPGNDPPDSSDERLAALHEQRETRLKPVLRTDMYEAFRLDRATAIVRSVHAKLDQGLKKRF